MDFVSFLGGLTLGAAAAVIYDLSSAPKMLGASEKEHFDGLLKPRMASKSVPLTQRAARNPGVPARSPGRYPVGNSPYRSAGY